jgi:predicted DCC family thiol-disulfide oxidoreductase YuxK
MSRAITPPKVLTRPVVVYSGTCRFCRWTANIVDRLDRDEVVGMVAHDDPKAEAIMGQISERDWDRSWQLVFPDGRRLMSGDATVELLSRLAYTRWLGRALAVLRLTPLVGLIYLTVSWARPYLSRLVPDKPGPRRFP